MSIQGVPEGAGGEAERSRGVARVLWVTLALNWAVAAVKIAVGLASGRATVMADGFHSLLDGANNLVGLVAVRVASRPPDAEHPYGHRKFEGVAAMAIGGMVVVLAWETMKQVAARAWDAVRNGGPLPPGAEAPAPDPWFVAAIGGSMAVNVAVSMYEKREGARLRSAFLTADADHTRADSVVTLMALASLFAGRQAWWLDPALAAVVAAFLSYAAYAILREALAALTERQRLDPETVRRCADAVPGVMNTHAIRSHGTANDIHLDLHVVVAEDLTARQTEAIEAAVAEALRRDFPAVTHVSVHHQTEAADPDAPVWRD